MKKEYDLCALTQGIEDVLFPVSLEEFKQLGDTLFKGTKRNWELGTWDLYTPQEMKLLIDALPERQPAMMSGGAATNSLILFSQLGGKVAMMTSLGDDDIGECFVRECQNYGIDVYQSKSHMPTGQCLSLITPNDRTMRTCLGAATSYNLDDLNLDLVRNSSSVLLEGFFLSGGEEMFKGMNLIIDVAKLNNTKVVFTVSDVGVIKNNRLWIEELVSRADVVFANEKEACELAKTNNVDKAAELLKNELQEFVITLGENGSYIVADKQIKYIPPVRCEPVVDLTGAGDTFAGAYLFGRSKNLEMEVAASFASKTASYLIQQKGAHFQKEEEIKTVKEYYNSCLSVELEYNTQITLPVS